MKKDIEILEKALELACYNQVANTFHLDTKDDDIQHLTMLCMLYYKDFNAQRLTRLYMDFYKDKAKDL